MHINEKLKGMWHGCDYNPDQWLDYPEILQKDITLMKKAGCNVMSIGIFAWSRLEPEEGVFEFKWLRDIIDNLYKNGIYTILATPSGAMPVWMAEKYPEIKRMGEDGIRNRFGNRHNNCYSSPVYREKVQIINTKLANEFANHPGVLMWHISNEYNVGDCHCPLCRENFRKWLEEKYETIETLNKKWWNGFWSHNYQNFSQIDPPGNHGENTSNPLRLEWHRFKNHMLKSFIKHEISAVKSVNPALPVTANFMEFLEIDYTELSKEIDFVSWDSYPKWHLNDDEYYPATRTAMFHSLFNSLKKDKPFMLMESSPSATNWQDVSKLRRPGVHHLASMQAIAHGSDTVQYFQWRKSRGQSEQFHGAVVGHDNSDDTRVFKEVSKVGSDLSKLKEISGSLTDNEVAILFDYDNLWSLQFAQAYRNCDKDKGYFHTLLKNFGALWQQNIGCDFVFVNDDFSKYKAIIAPMLFMLKPGLKKKIEKYVENGGIFITTFATGIIDENALAFIDKECYPFRKLLGVKAEETDSLYDNYYNYIDMFGETYKCEKYCEIAYNECAEIIGTYKEDFYKGMPAVTVNKYGKGKAYYIATDFLTDGYAKIYKECLKGVVSDNKIINTPENVSVTIRSAGEYEYIFILNFNNTEEKLELDFEYELICGEFNNETIFPYDVLVLRRKK